MQKKSLLLFCFAEVQPNLREAKVSANRAQCKRKACFYFVLPRCSLTCAKRKIVQTERNTKRKLAFCFILPRCSLTCVKRKLVQTERNASLLLYIYNARVSMPSVIRGQQIFLLYDEKSDLHAVHRCTSCHSQMYVLPFSDAHLSIYRCPSFHRSPPSD